jgi:hypothetical protein
MPSQLTIGWVGSTGQTYTVHYGTTGGTVNVITGITNNYVILNLTSTSAYTGYVETNCFCSSPKQYFSTPQSTSTRYYPYYVAPYENACGQLLEDMATTIYGNSSSFTTCSKFFTDLGGTIPFNGAFSNSIYWTTEPFRDPPQSGTIQLKINSTGNVTNLVTCP